LRSSQLCTRFGSRTKLSSLTHQSSMHDRRGSSNCMNGSASYASSAAFRARDTRSVSKCRVRRPERRYIPPWWVALLAELISNAAQLFPSSRSSRITRSSAPSRSSRTRFNSSRPTSASGFSSSHFGTLRPITYSIDSART
jgi:hypothetical protein